MITKLCSLKGLIATVVMLSATQFSASGANLLVNGSFEAGAYTGNDSWTGVGAGGTAITGWVATTGGADWHQTISAGGEFGPAFEGIRMVDLTFWADKGGIQQSFATTPGAAYRLSFAVASPAGDSNFDVKVAGLTESYAVPVSNRTSLNWAIKELDFVASDTQTTLEFVGQTANYWGSVIDDVSVAQVSRVPEGGALLGIWGVVMAGLSWARRRIA